MLQKLLWEWWNIFVSKLLSLLLNIFFFKWDDGWLICKTIEQNCWNEVEVVHTHTIKSLLAVAIVQCHWMQFDIELSPSYFNMNKISSLVGYLGWWYRGRESLNMFQFCTNNVMENIPTVLRETENVKCSTETIL